MLIDIGGRHVELRQVRGGILIRAENPGGQDGDQVEMGFPIPDKVPGSLLGERLGREIRHKAGAVLSSCFFVRRGVPVLLVVDVARPVTLGGVEHAGEGRSEDYPLDGGRILLDCLEDVSGSLEHGTDEVALIVLHVYLEGACGMDYPVDTPEPLH